MKKHFFKIFILSLFFCLMQKDSYGRIESFDEEPKIDLMKPFHKDQPEGSKNETQEVIKTTSAKTLETVKDSEEKPSPSLSLNYLYKKIINFPWLDLLWRLIRIIFIVWASFFIWNLLKNSVEKHLSKILHLKKKNNHTQTDSSLLKTIIPIIESLIQSVIIFLTILIVLSDLGIDITPIILSFSVIGLAFSLGATELAKDLINGVLTLFDGNIAVGDFVQIGSWKGFVETVSLRAITLRHSSGNVQTIPFSQAKTIINCSRQFNSEEILVSVAPHADIKVIEKAYKDVYNEMKKNPIFTSCILSELSEIGVKSMNVNGVITCASLRITPDPTDDFIVIFNRKLLEKIQELGVPLAYNPSASLLLDANAENQTEAAKEG